VESATLHMEALKLSPSKAEGKVIRERWNAVMDRAEEIKATGNWNDKAGQQGPANHLTPHVQNGENENQEFLIDLSENPSIPVVSVPASATRLQQMNQLPISKRSLPRNEEIILLRDSRLHGNTFPPWKSNPKAEEFEQRYTGELFT
jgi:hypothetical protein